MVFRLGGRGRFGEGWEVIRLIPSGCVLLQGWRCHKLGEELGEGPGSGREGMIRSSAFANNSLQSIYI